MCVAPLCVRNLVPPRTEWVVLTVITGLALPKLVAGAYRSELGLGRPGEAASSVVAAQRAARDVDESGHGGLWLWSIECAVDRVRVIYLSLLCGV